MKKNKAIGALTLATAGLLALAVSAAAAPAAREAVIVQARQLGDAHQAVLAVGGEVTHELGIIRAFQAGAFLWND